MHVNKTFKNKSFHKTLFCPFFAVLSFCNFALSRISNSTHMQPFSVGSLQPSNHCTVLALEQYVQSFLLYWYIRIYRTNSYDTYTPCFWHIFDSANGLMPRNKAVEDASVCEHIPVMLVFHTDNWPIIFGVTLFHCTAQGPHAARSFYYSPSNQTTRTFCWCP